MATRAEPVAGDARERDSVAAARQSRDATLAAGLVLGVLTLVWAWWAWRDGAFFGEIFYPGAIAVAILLLLLLRYVSLPPLRAYWGAAVVMAGLVSLGCWTALSAAWSPAPDLALSEAARVLLYAAAFGVGIWLSRLLAGRTILGLLPLAAAGGIVALGTAITLMTGDDVTGYLADSGSLVFPLGYHNANAAFFLVALWPILSLASAHNADWRLRGPMLGLAALCLEAAFLSQSRGSVPAVLAAIFVWLLVAPWRLRALVWLLLAVAAAAAALPWLTDVYTTFNDGDPVRAALEGAGRAMLITAAGAALVGLVVARFMPTPSRPPTMSRSLIPPLAAGIGVVLVGTAAVFAVAGEDPVDWVDARFEQLGRAESPALSGEQSRFGSNVSSKRPDQWRVAWEDARDAPIVGQGAGAHQFSYTRERDVDLTSRDPHSVEMKMVSELGFIGLAMFAAVVIGAVAVSLRARASGSAAAAVAGATLAAGTYWFVHTSIDWFWTYPAITAPVFALVGVTAGSALGAQRSVRLGRGRIAVAIAVAAVAVAVVPLYLSERYVNDAYRTWGDDLQGAYSDLDRAQALDPFSDNAFIAEGAIARAAGDRQRAVDAFREAVGRTPDEWVTHFYLGRLLAQDQPDEAKRELDIAAELNPRSEEVEQALDELQQ